MQELISLQLQTIDGNTVETVSARELYEQLGLDKSNWSRWSKSNIVDNPFAVENSDYVGFVIMTNGNETTDFAVTIDLAKKLAMQVRTEKGEMVRNYFLECEKHLKGQTQQIIDSNIEAKIRALKYVIDRTSLAPVAREALLITTAEEVIGVEIPYRPQLEKRTYSATEIGKQLGVSANKVGKITNAHNLKTNEYGVRVLDKARGHSKQVETWRYYDNVIPILKAILQNE